MTADVSKSLSPSQAWPSHCGFVALMGSVCQDCSASKDLRPVNFGREVLAIGLLTCEAPDMQRKVLSTHYMDEAFLGLWGLGAVR